MSLSRTKDGKEEGSEQLSMQIPWRGEGRVSEAADGPSTSVWLATRQSNSSHTRIRLAEDSEYRLGFRLFKTRFWSTPMTWKSHSIRLLSAAELIGFFCSISSDRVVRWGLLICASFGFCFRRRGTSKAASHFVFQTLVFGIDSPPAINSKREPCESSYSLIFSNFLNVSCARRWIGFSSRIFLDKKFDEAHQ